MIEAFSRVYSLIPLMLLVILVIQISRVPTQQDFQKDHKDCPIWSLLAILAILTVNWRVSRKVDIKIETGRPPKQKVVIFRRKVTTKRGES